MKDVRIAVPCLMAVLLAIGACSASPVRPHTRGVTRDGDVVAGTGTIRFYSVEGGFFAIRGDDDVTYDPVNLQDAFKQDGMPIYFRARLRDMASIHMVGPIVEILEMTPR